MDARCGLDMKLTLNPDNRVMFDICLAKWFDAIVYMLFCVLKYVLSAIWCSALSYTQIHISTKSFVVCFREVELEQLSIKYQNIERGEKYASASYNGAYN